MNSNTIDFNCIKFIVLLFINPIRVFGVYNDCTSLVRECCWRPSNQSVAWQQYESIDQAWYRRTFRSRILRPPPAQTYYSSILTNPSEVSALESCSYCSRSGNVKLWIRHWASASTLIQVCWRQKSGLREITECRDLDQGKNGLIDSEQVSVQRNIPVFFSIVIKSNNSTQSNVPVTGIVDFLNVRSELCSLNIQKLKSTRFVLLGGSHLNKLTTSTLLPPQTSTNLLPIVITPDPKVVESFFNEDGTNGIDDETLASERPEVVKNPNELWTSARDIDFLVPRQEQSQELAPRVREHLLGNSPQAPLSFSNMFGLVSPTPQFEQPSTLSPFQSGLAINQLKLGNQPTSQQSNDIRPESFDLNTQNYKMMAFKKTTNKPNIDEFVELGRSEDQQFGNNFNQLLPATTLPPKLFNPFSDLFGEEFASFLDPSFNTSKYDELEIRHEQQHLKPAEKSSGIVNQRKQLAPKLQIQSLPSTTLSGRSRPSQHAPSRALPTLAPTDGDSHQLQTMSGMPSSTTPKVQLNRLERIDFAGPDQYRKQFNPLKLKPPGLVAVEARLFNKENLSSATNTTKLHNFWRNTTGSEPKFTTTKFTEAKFTKLQFLDNRSQKIQTATNLPTPTGPTRKTNFWNSSPLKKELEVKKPKQHEIEVDMPKIGQLRVDNRMERKSKRKCNYSGGCLFEKTSCNFTNSRTLSTNSQFRRVSVGSSNFVEARVGSGDVAVYESRINSNDNGFHVLFDYLEWTEGEKLSACCHTPGRQPIELYCPFESTTNETEIKWQSERIRCEPETKRILFICENFGTQTGICALDNIRLHAEWDREFDEPCQGDQLALL